MDSLACLNGEILPADEARVPIWDRGFLFGDAIYEVFRLYSGRCWLEEAHWARLKRSLREMDIRGVEIDRLADRMFRTIEISGILEGTAYIHITRGVAPRAHVFPGPEIPPTELIVIREYDDSKAAPLRLLGVPVITQPDLRWGRCDVKSTNLLANVIAYNAAQRQGAFEAILCDGDNVVTEATHSSLLWVREGRLEATRSDWNILPGTTRDEVVRLAGVLGIPFEETTINPVELMQMDEVLMAGTTIEVMPVVSINGRPVGHGRPGPITAKLQPAFADSLADWLEAPPK